MFVKCTAVVSVRLREVQMEDILTSPHMNESATLMLQFGTKSLFVFISFRFMGVSKKAEARI